MAYHGPFLSLANFLDPLLLSEILNIENSEYLKYAQ